MSDPASFVGESITRGGDPDALALSVPAYSAGLSDSLRSSNARYGLQKGESNLSSILTAAEVRLEGRKQRYLLASQLYSTPSRPAPPQVRPVAASPQDVSSPKQGRNGSQPLSPRRALNGAIGLDTKTASLNKASKEERLAEWRQEWFRKREEARIEEVKKRAMELLEEEGQLNSLVVHSPRNTRLKTNPAGVIHGSFSELTDTDSSHHPVVHFPLPMSERGAESDEANIVAQPHDPSNPLSPPRLSARLNRTSVMVPPLSNLDTPRKSHSTGIPLKGHGNGNPRTSHCGNLDARPSLNITPLRHPSHVNIDDNDDGDNEPSGEVINDDYDVVAMTSPLAPPSAPLSPTSSSSSSPTSSAAPLSASRPSSAINLRPHSTSSSSADDISRGFPTIRSKLTKAIQLYSRQEDSSVLDVLHMNGDDHTGEITINTTSSTKSQSNQSIVAMLLKRDDVYRGCKIVYGDGIKVVKRIAPREVNDDDDNDSNSDNTERPGVTKAKSATNSSSVLPSLSSSSPSSSSSSYSSSSPLNNIDKSLPEWRNIMRLNSTPDTIPRGTLFGPETLKPRARPIVINPITKQEMRELLPDHSKNLLRHKLRRHSEFIMRHRGKEEKEKISEGTEGVANFASIEESGNAGRIQSVIDRHDGNLHTGVSSTNASSDNSNSSNSNNNNNNNNTNSDGSLNSARVRAMKRAESGEHEMKKDALIEKRYILRMQTHPSRRDKPGVIIPYSIDNDEDDDLSQSGRSNERKGDKGEEGVLIGSNPESSRTVMEKTLANEIHLALINDSNNNNNKRNSNKKDDTSFRTTISPYPVVPNLPLHKSSQLSSTLSHTLSSLSSRNITHSHDMPSITKATASAASAAISGAKLVFSSPPTTSSSSSKSKGSYTTATMSTSGGRHSQPPTSSVSSSNNHKATTKPVRGNSAIYNHHITKPLHVEICTGTEVLTCQVTETISTDTSQTKIPTNPNSTYNNSKVLASSLSGSSTLSGSPSSTGPSTSPIILHHQSTPIVPIKHHSKGHIHSTVTTTPIIIDSTPTLLRSHSTRPEIPMLPLPNSHPAPLLHPSTTSDYHQRRPPINFEPPIASDVSTWQTDDKHKQELAGWSTSSLSPSTSNPPSFSTPTYPSSLSTSSSSLPAPLSSLLNLPIPTLVPANREGKGKGGHRDESHKSHLSLPFLTQLQQRQQQIPHHRHHRDNRIVIPKRVLRANPFPLT